MSRQTVAQESKLYHRFSHVYDAIFEPLFRARLDQTIRQLGIEPGSRVLEVGVGTGISLGSYPRHAEVYGVDLSEAMLAEADRKVRQNGWTHVRLQQMNALNLEFPDEHFDYVTAFHIASVVPDPQRLMHEICRVTRPGGKLAVVNHFRSERKWVGTLTDLLDPVTRRLGWSTTLSLHDIVEDAPLTVQKRFKTSRSSLYTVIIARRELQPSRRF